MKLRHRLMIAVAALLVLGLVVVNVVTYTAVRSFLYGRIGEQLAVTQHQVYNYLARAERRGRRPNDDVLANLVSPDVYVLVFGQHNRLWLQAPSGSDVDPDPAPALPARFGVAPLPPNQRFGRHAGPFREIPDSFVTSSHQDPTARYLAAAVAVPGGVLIAAESLNSMYATLSSLLRIQLVVSVLVVLTICVVAWLVVRRGLRPLEEMAITAGAIASGDLGRRVPEADDTSEVGRLGAALNVMLGRIEAAFNQRAASEASLRQFVSDASHELRTPLTSILGYTELLRKGAFADDVGRRRALERVEHEAVRMSALVDQLLLLARIDEGREFDRVPVALALVAAEAVEDARAVDPERQIELRVEAERPVIVLGDRDGLRQVAHNLVRNALAHTPAAAGVKVLVSEDGDRGVLQVVDEGPGLGPAEQARVFDRFYRGDSSRGGASTGLGLAIVKAIAESLEGTVSVDSSIGRGTTFTVTLALAPAGSEVPTRTRWGAGRLATGSARPPGPAGSAERAGSAGGAEQREQDERVATGVQRLDDGA